MSSMLLLLGILATSSAAAATEGDRPNVVIIMTDDQGFGDLGVQGHPVLKTPRIDALAAESATVGAFYVHPVCTPTRAALFTGRHPQRTTAIDTWIGRAMLEPEEVTIAERLREAGYATGIFGKWHLGDCHPMRPMDQGFDVSVVHRGGGISQPADPEGGEGRYTDPILRRNGVLESFEGWCTDVYVDEMTAWMEAQHGPFLAVLTTNAPHGPFHDIPVEEYQRYKAMDLEPTGASNHDRMARILAMDANIDENVGRILDTLERLGMAETLWCSTSTTTAPITTATPSACEAARARSTKAAFERHSSRGGRVGFRRGTERMPSACTSIWRRPFSRRAA